MYAQFTWAARREFCLHVRGWLAINTTLRFLFPEAQMADVASRAALASDAAVDRSGARRRRRRLQMRRIETGGGGGDALLASEEENGSAPERRRWSAVPVVGAVAVAGRQREMEDAITVWTSLCSPAVNRFLPVHYFAVYDGHGGSHFSTICKQKMHEILKEELMGGAAELIADENLLRETWKSLINRVFAKTEMVALHTCGCGSVGFRCSCDDRSSLSYSGTTAVAVILTEEHYVVGNCGDSRAVIYRGGRTIPLSFDHKPERVNEKARVEASGGRVVNTDTPRVQGILAMSRAIGDVFLKPYVISAPEVRLISRKEEDEFLILASDGMWDVIPNDMAGRVVHQCLKEPSATLASGASDSTAVFPSRSSSAASLLTRLALARDSADNISVVVVDLKRG